MDGDIVTRLLLDPLIESRQESRPRAIRCRPAIVAGPWGRSPLVSLAHAALARSIEMAPIATFRLVTCAGLKYRNQPIALPELNFVAVPQCFCSSFCLGVVSARQFGPSNDFARSIYLECTILLHGMLLPNSGHRPRPTGPTAASSPIACPRYYRSNFARRPPWRACSFGNCRKLCEP